MQRRFIIIHATQQRHVRKYNRYHALNPFNRDGKISTELKRVADMHTKCIDLVLLQHRHQLISHAKRVETQGPRMNAYQQIITNAAQCGQHLLKLAVGQHQWVTAAENHLFNRRVPADVFHRILERVGVGVSFIGAHLQRAQRLETKLAIGIAGVGGAQDHAVVVLVLADGRLHLMIEFPVFGTAVVVALHLFAPIRYYLAPQGVVHHLCGGE